MLEAGAIDQRYPASIAEQIAALRVELKQNGGTDELSDPILNAKLVALMSDSFEDATITVEQQRKDEAALEQVREWLLDTYGRRRCSACSASTRTRMRSPISSSSCTPSTASTSARTTRRARRSGSVTSSVPPRAVTTTGGDDHTGDYSGGDAAEE